MNVSNGGADWEIIECLLISDYLHGACEQEMNGNTEKRREK